MPGDDPPFLPPGLGELFRDPDPMRGWREQQARWDRELGERINKANAEKERQRQEIELRENRLAAIAEAGHQRELRGEGRERLLLAIAILTLLVSIVAAVASLLALAK